MFYWFRLVLWIIDAKERTLNRFTLRPLGRRGPWGSHYCRCTSNERPDPVHQLPDSGTPRSFPHLHRTIYLPQPTGTWALTMFSTYSYYVQFRCLLVINMKYFTLKVAQVQKGEHARYESKGTEDTWRYRGNRQENSV